MNARHATIGDINLRSLGSVASQLDINLPSQRNHARRGPTSAPPTLRSATAKKLAREASLSQSDDDSDPESIQPALTGPDNPSPAARVPRQVAQRNTSAERVGSPASATPAVGRSSSALARTSSSALSRSSVGGSRAAVANASPSVSSLRRAGFDELDSLKPQPEGAETWSMDPYGMEYSGMEYSGMELADGTLMNACMPNPCCLSLAGRLYGSGEIMSFWAKGMDVPPLVASSAVGTARANIGVLGTPGTTVLFGGTGLNDDAELGARFILGYRLQQFCNSSLEAGYLFMGDAGTTFNASSATAPLMGRPFNNTTTGLPDAVQLSVPGELSGSISVQAETQFQLYDFRLRSMIAQGPCMALDLLLGYRHANLEDDLSIADSITTLVAFPPPAPVVPAGTTLSGIDQFHAANKFDGGQIGLSCNLNRGRLSWDMLMNVSLGCTTSEVFINGSTTTTLPGAAAVTQPGSKLALPSNMGTYKQDQFTVLPEFGLRMNYDLGPKWRLSAAYTLIYWSHVARAGNQIDTSIDPNQFPIPNVPPGTGIWPQFPFAFDDFWAQAIGLRVEHQF